MLDMGSARLIMGIGLWGAGGKNMRGAMAVGFLNTCGFVGCVLAEYARHHPVAHPCHTLRAALGL